MSRRAITLEEKNQIINKLANGESNADVCRQFGLPSSTVSTIWKNRAKLQSTMNSNISKMKKISKPVNSGTEKALLNWFKQKRIQNVPISGLMLQKKAEYFSRLLSPDNQNVSCSRSWIYRFKRRYCITSRKMHGEAASVSASASASESEEDWLNYIWPDIRKNYSNDDIFNADETGIFFKLMPNQTLKFQNEKCSGGEKSKDRITVLVCANMSGKEKRELLVIGKPRTPSCLKSCKNLPVKYTSNEKSWITSEIFETEIRKWDLDLQKKKRNIILLVDNCPAHPCVENLRSIKLVFLPPNMNAILQPMNQGIIACFKSHYKKIFLSNLFSHLDNGEKFKFSLLDAIFALNRSWNLVSSKTISNCYRHAGFYPEYEEIDDIPLAEWLRINDEIPSAQWLRINDGNSQGDSLSLFDWAKRNNLINRHFSDKELQAYESVDESLDVCGNLSDPEIATSVKTNDKSGRILRSSRVASHY
ncbi:tigger transposable element-derived protein 4-like [Harmonia axyridis]|uniref:tigger transposable element-derived protein 4-like n=1 Tax=Harmonia axyridis TaxID=115357 RepID=UPI001E2792D6|nr:tigger transposable element-derived protein 4-like [Harmonia axyridis]